ncbi:unnamed protein product [Pleuronectes platessa]|uniref:Uncharacterized protein n=1 Tax=Pleuronectes platessa TaxID=8262 RepID=A0A9N7UDE2_PLEPL|nr:unnamed protein product [Pleuronectes platessa]
MPGMPDGQSTPACRSFKRLQVSGRSTFTSPYGHRLYVNTKSAGASDPAASSLGLELLTLLCCLSAEYVAGVPASCCSLNFQPIRVCSNNSQAQVPANQNPVNANTGPG